jgi:type I restriction enzyme S subunit
MNIVGPPLGKVAVVSDEYPEWSINQALTLFRPSEVVTSEWLYLFLRSGISVAGIMDQTRGSVGQVNISLTQCREFAIPVPSVEEQAEIATRVRSLLDGVETLSAALDRVADDLARAARGALTRAFRGELVPTEAELAEEAGAAFESGDELLERIRISSGAPG